MNILEAGKYLHEGKKIRRKIWGFNIMRQDGSERILINQENIEALIFMTADLLADDWEVIEEKSPMQKGIDDFRQYNASYHATVEEAYQIAWRNAEAYFKSQK